MHAPPKHHWLSLCDFQLHVGHVPGIIPSFMDMAVAFPDDGMGAHEMTILMKRWGRKQVFILGLPDVSL